MEKVVIYLLSLNEQWYALALPTASGRPPLMGPIYGRTTPAHQQMSPFQDESNIDDPDSVTVNPLVAAGRWGQSTQDRSNQNKMQHAVR